MPKQLTREEILRVAEKAAKEWQNDYASNDKIKGQVRGLLQARFTNLVAQALGFECRWSEWEIRHTYTETPLTKAIGDAATAMATELLGEPLPALGPKDVDGIRRAYEKGLREKALEVAYELGAAKAETLVQETLDEVVEESAILPAAPTTEDQKG